MGMSGVWVDEFLLEGAHRTAALTLDEPLGAEELGACVDREQQRLTEAGLCAGGSVALRLPPSLAVIATMLAAWRIGAQVALIDYRLTGHEAGAAVARIDPQFVVTADREVTGRLRGYFTVESVITPRPEGSPADTDHVLLQLSSGSTGASKVIGRRSDSLMAEVERYSLIEGFPRPGERIVVLASVIHVLGLVGGLLYGFHNGLELVLPSSHTADAVHRAVAAAPTPTTILGVPSQAALLATVSSPPPLPQLRAMVTGGEVMPARERERFTTQYGVPLGAMYGMTEAGVIATDLSGALYPALRPAPGMGVRVEEGHILLGLPDNPYVGATEPDRYVDGWLRTKDAGTYDPDGELLTVHGRLDQQISVGGLKVDLSEVEELIKHLPGVSDAVVVHGAGIEAYVSLADPAVTGDELSSVVATRLAAYKRPRRLHIVPQLPRTPTGKPVRNPEALRAVARAAVTL